MNYTWSKTVFPIAALFSFRLLGLFLLIPVFTLYAPQLKNATPLLIGIALGIYGLSQGLLQIPFGMLSDKWGRKPVLTLGLILFTLGSLLGAYSDSIQGIILARALQGGGAIGSVLIALLADLTPDKDRTKAMAIIGITIGTSFSLAIITSSALTQRYGLAGIFYLTTALAFISLLILYFIIPTPRDDHFDDKPQSNLFLLKSALNNYHLTRLNIGIFCQHAILTSTFFALPIILNQHIQAGHLQKPWYFYLPLMIFSFFAMGPFLLLAEKKKQMKSAFLIAVLITVLTQSLLSVSYTHWTGLCLLMFLYFSAFNFLEASLPSLVSKQAHASHKGTAMGIYSTSQFLGIFFGGLLAGALYQWRGHEALFIINTILGIAWLCICTSMRPNDYYSTLVISYPLHQQNQETLASLLRKIPGVHQVELNLKTSTIYLYVHKETYQDGSAEQLIKQLNTTPFNPEIAFVSTLGI